MAQRKSTRASRSRQPRELIGAAASNASAVNAGLPQVGPDTFNSSAVSPAPFLGERPPGADPGMPLVNPATIATPDSLPVEKPEPGSIVWPQVAERWYQTVSKNLQPETIDRYLTNAISGAVSEQFRLFEEMEEKCPPLRTALHKHKLHVAMRKGRIVPPDFPENDNIAKKKADFANVAWSRIREWPRTLYNALDMVGKNISLAEIEWLVSSVRGQTAVTIDRMPWVNYRHVVWWPDSPDLQLIPDLRTINRIAIPPRKFVMFEHLSKSGHAARGGFLRVLAFHFLIYLYALKDWSSLAEVFGADIAWAFYRSQGNNGDADRTEQDKILMHLSRIAMKAGVFPEGTQIHVERAASSSGGAPQEALIRHIEDSMLKLILGGTLGTSAGEKGARSLGEVQVEETDRMCDWTAILTSSTITDTALLWLMQFNFAEPGDNPKFELPGANRKDITALANILKILVSVGVQIPERWAHEEFDIPEPAGGTVDGEAMEPVLKAAPSQGQFGQSGAGGSDLGGDGFDTLTGKTRRLIGALDTGHSTITEHQTQAILDALRDQAVRKGADVEAFDQITGPIKRLVARNSDPAAALAELDSVTKGIEPTKLAGIHSELMILCNLLGRATVAEQTGAREKHSGTAQAA